jgi:hypothetical protein
MKWSIWFGPEITPSGASLQPPGRLPARLPKNREIDGFREFQRYLADFGRFGTDPKIPYSGKEMSQEKEWSIGDSNS